MKQYQITGLGPLNKDGSRLIFTRLANPFTVNAVWIAAQPIAPDTGEIIEIMDDGALAMVGEAKVAGNPPIEAANANEAQKKSTGSAGHGASSLAEFSSYKGKPVIVHASEIAAIGEHTSDGFLEVTLAGGAIREATPEMLARMTPVVGDYWVIVPQDSCNYEYLNPKAVFENKYELIAE